MHPGPPPAVLRKGFQQSDLTRGSGGYFTQASSIRISEDGAPGNCILKSLGDSNVQPGMKITVLERGSPWGS